MRYRKSSSEREVNCNKGLCQKQGKYEINNIMFYLKELEKKNKQSPKSEERRNNKDRSVF